MGRKYDFSGWATVNDLRCSDGRTIRRNAFADNDGKKVPLVWMHQHNDPFNVLGHAYLENRDKGVYAYCSLNDTEAGKAAREYLRHGDIDSLSIFAGQLKQNGADVLHGDIKEVSLVLAGANPGAYIDSVMIHGDNSDEEAMIFTGEPIAIRHSDFDDEEEDEMDNRTYGDIIDTMNDEQKEVVDSLIDALADAAPTDEYDDDDEEDYDDEEFDDEEDYDDEDEGLDEEDDDTDYDEEDESMGVRHSVFDNYEQDNGDFLSHADQAAIINDAKQFGTLKESFMAHADAMGYDGNFLQHDADSDAGIVRSQDVQNYFVNDPSFLFPDARATSNVPAWIKRKTDWVSVVMNGAKHSPFSRVKTLFADITEDEARAKGYIKGNLKTEEVFTLLKRTTTPTTVYKKQKMDRDDVLDITDFDVVAWIRGEMRMMLDEEIARAALIGDGRLTSSNDKINEQNIRPIWKDHPLFTIQKTIPFAANATDDDKAKAIIKGAVKARKDYRGSGNPTFFTTEDVLTDMLLLEDTQGYRLYKNVGEVASAMRVSNIVTVPIMENQTRVVDSVTRTLLGIIVNMSDYTFGADKGGQVSMFDDFDIDYNQQKYLIETRCSGALTVPYSAIAIEGYTAAG